MTDYSLPNWWKLRLVIIHFPMWYNVLIYPVRVKHKCVLNPFSITSSLSFAGFIYMNWQHGKESSLYKDLNKYSKKEAKMQQNLSINLVLTTSTVSRQDFLWVCYLTFVLPWFSLLYYKMFKDYTSNNTTELDPDT